MLRARQFRLVAFLVDFGIFLPLVAMEG